MNQILVRCSLAGKGPVRADCRRDPLAPDCFYAATRLFDRDEYVGLPEPKLHGKYWTKEIRE